MPLPPKPQTLGTILRDYQTSSNNDATQCHSTPDIKRLQEILQRGRSLLTKPQKWEDLVVPPNLNRPTRHTPKRRTLPNRSSIRDTPIRIQARPETTPETPLPKATELLLEPRSLHHGVHPSDMRAPTRDHQQKHLFVLDTNVLLHDPHALFRFAEHDIFLPLVVLEELDRHKIGLSEVARNARATARTLDRLLSQQNTLTLRDGLSLVRIDHTAQGKLFFETQACRLHLPSSLTNDKADNQILGVVSHLQKESPRRQVILVSKDINMRIKATALGLKAEDYYSDKVMSDSDFVFPGRRTLVEDFWEKIALHFEWLPADKPQMRFGAQQSEEFIRNEFVHVANDETQYRVIDKSQNRITLQTVEDYRKKRRVAGLLARNHEQAMAFDLLLDPSIDLVTLLGPAGTGKTLCTLAAAVDQVKEGRYQGILVTRATVSLGEDIGFLPGTEEEKMAPWMGAIDDNLDVIENALGSRALIDIREKIRTKSIAFMRGRTLQRQFIIIDEAQNLTPKELKALITRAGPGSKIVCLGNLAQIDTPYLTEGSSGLTYVAERFLDWPHAATITLCQAERSRLAEFANEVL